MLALQTCNVAASAWHCRATCDRVNNMHPDMLAETFYLCPVTGNHANKIISRAAKHEFDTAQDLVAAVHACKWSPEAVTLAICKNLGDVNASSASRSLQSLCKIEHSETHCLVWNPWLLYGEKSYV